MPVQTRTLETERLLLRRWKAADHEPFARMNRDLRVSEFLAGPLGRDKSDRLIERIEHHFVRYGFGLWAAELRGNGGLDPVLIGYVGLSVPVFEAHFTPCVEIGWRLAPEHWGRGLATEGAREVIRHAFEELDLPALVSFTVPANVRSRRVMEKLGMTHDPREDFNHPGQPEGHALRRHVLYRISR
jgi:RimJ/RimL family protein N-acetyltransferase